MADLKRRGFIGAALVTFGGAIGWLARRNDESRLARKTEPTPLDSRFVYDVSEFEKTDPALLRYKESARIPTGLEKAKRLAAAPGNEFWVMGERSLKLLDVTGAVRQQFTLDRVPHCVETAGSILAVGFANFYEMFDLTGKSLFRSPRLGESTFLTSMAMHEKILYLADAGEREVIVCERDTGKTLDRFGSRDKVRNNPGFNVPSPYFDLAIGPDRRLRVANPGRLRIETYSLEGRFESSWGEPGLKIDRFCGCCNPVYFTLRSNGDFITSEKGLARINIYDSNGVFKGAVAGPDLLVEDKQLARRACSDCTVGGAFDVAVSDNGQVLVLDPFQNCVRVFSPAETT